MKKGFTNGQSLNQRYRQFRLTLMLAITFLSMIPATITAIGGYLQYISLLERQDMTILQWHMQHTKKEINNYLVRQETSARNDLGNTFFNSLKDINGKVLDDIFLIDKSNRLITPSHLDNQQELFPHAIQSGYNEIILSKSLFGIRKTFIATSSLNETPWTLVLVKDGPIHQNEWWSFQIKQLLTFIFCTSIGLLIIYQLVNLLTYRIRVSDIKRMSLFSEIGHNNRLATIGRLATGVAHEINNPLAVIDQKAGLMEDYLEISEDFKHKEKLIQAIEGINNNVNRCKKITHRLLGFARKVDASHEELNINDIIKEVLGFLEKEAIYNNIKLVLNLKEVPLTISDRGQLQQILLNIVNNAIDAIGKNGVVTISTSLKNKKLLKIAIEDNGPGIKPAIMKHIFDPFFTTKGPGKGTGLGLAITHGLMTKLGGDIKVSSSKDEGTAFTLYLPIRENHNYRTPDE